MRDATLAGVSLRRLMIPISVAWITVFAVTVAFLVVGLPARLNQLSVACSDSGTTCAHYQLTEVAERVLLNWGLSLSTYAWILTALIIVLAPIYLSLALVIFLRSRGQLMMLVPAFGLLLFLPGYFVSINEAITHEHPDWIAVIGLLQVMAIWIGILFGFTFPSGTFFPGWTRPLMFVATLAAGTLAFNPTARLFSASGPPVAYWLSFVILALFATAFWAQISRFRHRSTLTERQQTKWIVFGFSILVVEMVSFGLAPILFPAIRDPGQYEVLYTLANAMASATAAVILAISFGVAILRYRLFDIDVIINRTLVYSALTLTLAAVYATAVVLGEFLLRPLNPVRPQNPDSDLAVVISTLLVAALFQPVRRRIQANVDRRFFRQKYDAERTIAAFRAVARDELDLDRLSSELVRVLHESMQPTRISFWLRKR